LLARDHSTRPDINDGRRRVSHAPSLAHDGTHVDAKSGATFRLLCQLVKVLPGNETRLTVRTAKPFVNPSRPSSFRGLLQSERAETTALSKPCQGTGPQARPALERPPFRAASPRSPADDQIQKGLSLAT
jgi:hypothetical protein